MATNNIGTLQNSLKGEQSVVATKMRELADLTRTLEAEQSKWESLAAQQQAVLLKTKLERDSATAESRERQAKVRAKHAGCCVCLTCVTCWSWSPPPQLSSRSAVLSAMQPVGRQKASPECTRNETVPADVQQSQVQVEEIESSLQASEALVETLRTNLTQVRTCTWPSHGTTNQRHAPSQVTQSTLFALANPFGLLSDVSFISEWHCANRKS